MSEHTWLPPQPQVRQPDASTVQPSWGSPDAAASEAAATPYGYVVADAVTDAGHAAPVGSAHPSGLSPQHGSYVPPAWTAYGLPQPEGDPKNLDLPWYGIGFIDAIKRAHVKAFRYEGRASLGEYWWFQLFTVLAFLLGYGVVLGTMFATVPSNGPGSETLPPIAIAVLVLFGLGMLFEWAVWLALMIRRLHDAGYSGAWYLLSFLPFGGLVVLVFLASAPKPEGQRFDRVSPDAYAAA